MKKLILSAGMLFLTTTFTFACEFDKIKKSACVGFLPCYQIGIPPPSVLNFPFTFRHSFPSSTKQNESFFRIINNSTAVYSGFKAMRYEFPEQSYFCRMENESCKRYGFMFSIHAGGYSER